MKHHQSNRGRRPEPSNRTKKQTMKTKQNAHGDMTDLDSPLYEQQPGESTAAFAAFQCYLEMGDGRTQEAVGAKLAKSRQLISRWSSHWSWGNRVKAWTRKISRQGDAAVRAEMEDKARVWAAREQKMREDAWRLSGRLLAKVDQMLKQPLVQQRKTTVMKEEKDGAGRVVKIVHHTTIINPARWDFGTAARCAEIVVNLQRLATGVDRDTGAEDAPAVTPASTPAPQVILYLPDNGRAGTAPKPPMAKPGEGPGPGKSGV